MNPPIAVISSTIAPPDVEHYGGKRRRFDPDERLEQTRASIQSLLELGLTEIHVADNSGANWRDYMDSALTPARVHRCSQYPYRNLGISELQMLLALLPALPVDRPIIKLSGRYRLKRRLDLELGADELVVREWRGARLINCCISTVAYAVCDAATYARFLRETLRDVFGFQARIVGPRSFVRILRNSLFPDRDHYPYDDPTGPIEHSAWRALRNARFRVRALDSIGVEGRSGALGTPLTE